MWRFEKRDFLSPEDGKRVDFVPMPPGDWDDSKKWTIVKGGTLVPSPVTQEVIDVEVRRQRSEETEMWDGRRRNGDVG